MDAQNQLKDDMILIFSYMVILFLSIFIPAFFLIDLFIFPIPLVIYAVNHERQRLFMMTGVLAIIVFSMSLVLQTMLLIPLFVTSITSGLAIGIALQKKR